jgi:hypothetical protein
MGQGEEGGEEEVGLIAHRRMIQVSQMTFVGVNSCHSTDAGGVQDWCPPYFRKRQSIRR